MNTILLAIIAACLLVIAFFLVPMTVELRRTLAALRKTTEENLGPALDEMRASLKSVRNISDGLGEITSDVRVFTRSVSEIGHSVNVINDLARNLGTSMAVKTLSLKAAASAAIGYFVGNLMRKGD